MTDSETIRPRLVSLDAAFRALGVGRTLGYEFIKRGWLKTIKVGRRNLTEPAAIDECLEILRAESAKKDQAAA